MAEKNPRRAKTGAGLDTPMSARARFFPRLAPNPDAFGSATEKFARFMGTPQFLVWMTVFCIVWLAWNTIAPPSLRFDSAAMGFTALTLMLSLQASYAAPLLLLAQNRQDDRDRVSLTEDRSRAERNLHDTEYLTREIASLRMMMRDVATRDFVRSELRNVLEELLEEREGVEDESAKRRRERERASFEREKEREEKEREEREKEGRER